MIKRITTFIYTHIPTPLLRLYRRIRSDVRNSTHPVAQRIDGVYERISQTYRGTMGMRFVSLAEMTVLVDEWTTHIDRDFDVVVGVPRSGLLVASMLATKLGKPLATPDTIDTVWVSKHAAQPDPKRYMLVDDSVGSGRALERAIIKLTETGIAREQIYTGGLIVCKDTAHMVDTYATSIEFPRFFEWNMLHSKQDIVVDMDGVLCAEPMGDDTRNDATYEKWIQNVAPYLIPTFEIPVILTSRLEKYRTETERWLAQNGVQYGELIMSQCTTREEQRNAGSAFKIEYLKERKPAVYWESSSRVAHEINEHTGIPVLAVDNMELIG